MAVLIYLPLDPSLSVYGGLYTDNEAGITDIVLNLGSNLA